MEQVATMAGQDQSRVLDARLTTGLHSIRSTLVPRLGRTSVSTASTAEREEKTAEAWTILSYGLGVSVSLIPLTLICLRVEEMISCSWAIIAIPLWISKGLYLCCLWCCVIDDTPSGIHIAWSTFMSALLAISQVNIVMKLDGTLDWSVVHALVPYFVYDGLNLVADCLFTGNPLDAMFRIVQTTLVAAKIDGHLQCSWWIVFIPSWIGIGSAFVCMMVSVVSMQISEEKLSFVCCSFFSYALAVALLLAPPFIMVARLEGGTFSTFYVILPLVILSGSLVLFGVGALVKVTCCPHKTCSQPKHSEEIGATQPYNPVQVV